MPERARVLEFVAMVVSGDHVRAIADFYHEDATMQENRNEPRRGRAALMTHEEKALSKIKCMHTHPAELVFVDGDNVAIRWTFDRIGKDDSVTRLEEIAQQSWKGDRILHERFYYDTASAWFSVDGQDAKKRMGTAIAWVYVIAIVATTFLILGSSPRALCSAIPNSSLLYCPMLF